MSEHYFTDLTEWPKVQPSSGKHEFLVVRHEQDNAPGSSLHTVGRYPTAAEAVVQVTSLTSVRPVEWMFSGPDIISRELGGCGEHSRWLIQRQTVDKNADRRWERLAPGMVRTDRFVISHRPYAVKLDTFRSGGMGHREIDAVWFQRKNRQTGACIGRLWGGWGGDGEPAVRPWLGQIDGRYGGECISRWNGRSLWTACAWDVAQGHQEFLTSMLAAYPAIPPGYDGWWVFRR